MSWRFKNPASGGGGEAVPESEWDRRYRPGRARLPGRARHSGSGLPTCADSQQPGLNASYLPLNVPRPNLSDTYPPDVA
eukprot:764931-Hanusia_phi.AAC.5